jgi:hypothetical protein
MESKHFNERLTKYLKEKNNAEAKKHQSSGKISPSKIAQPTLEAVLQLLGVQADPPSDQSLRFFLRGHTVEEAIAPSLAFGQKTHKLQVEAKYRNGFGLIDSDGEYPHEIKSAGFQTWKSVTRNGKPKLSHALQGTFYALGTHSKYCWLHYVNTDTYQVHSFRIEPSEYKEELDRRIDAIQLAFAYRTLPDYIPLDSLHENVMYSNYAEFFNKKGDEATKILKKYHPEQYRLLISGELIERINDGNIDKHRTQKAN